MKDIPQLLQISFDKPWSSVKAPLPCEEVTARQTLIQALESNGLLYRFNFFHLREVITYFYSQHRHQISAKDTGNQWRRRAEFETLTTIRAVRDLVAKMGDNPALAPHGGDEENGWTKPFLIACGPGVNINESERERSGII